MNKKPFERDSRIKIKSDWIRRVGCLLVQSNGKILGFKLPLKLSNIPADSVILLDKDNYLVKSRKYLPKEKLTEYKIELKK